MPITGLPTFTDGILTSAQLNAIVSALESKFAANISGADISWPLVAGGDLNMANYQILNMGKFWNAYNLADRPASDSVQDVLDDLNADGGGTVIVPGGHTETMPAAGVVLYDNVNIIGEGDSSVLQIASSSSDSMIRATSGVDGARISSLKLKGNTSENNTLLYATNADNLRVSSVTFETHGTSPFLHIEGGCIDAIVDDCTFEGNGDTNTQQLVKIDGAVGVRILNSRFHDWVDRALYIIPDAGSTVVSVIVSGCDFNRDFATAANMSGVAAIDYDNTQATASQGFIFTHNVIRGKGANVGGIHVLGGGLTGLNISSNVIHTNIDQPAIQVYSTCSDFVINDNQMSCSGEGDGIVIGSNGGSEDTRGTQTASACTDFAICGNRIQTNAQTQGKGVGLILALTSTSTGLRAAIGGNCIQTRESHALEIWNTSTTRPVGATICGNHLNPASSSYKGFAGFSDMGSTNNADIGTAAISWYFTFVGNHSPNSASGTDFTHSTANKCVVQDNNT